MDIFAQNKFLIRLVVLLVALNLFSMGIFMWKEFSQPKQHPSPPEQREQREDYHDVSDVLQRELNLNSQQVEQIQKLREDVFEKETAIKEVIRGERDSMNLLMFNKNSDNALIKTLAREVSENEYKMELLRYEQAQSLKAICTPKQLEKFDKLVIEIRDYFRPDNRPGEK
jgi:Spy/CpxP family protein refolding chaperone